MQYIYWWIFGCLCFFIGYMVACAFAEHGHKDQDSRFNDLVIVVHKKRYLGQLDTIRGLMKNQEKRRG